jgi:pimeloyl-ACP methyl ester carboxylesterase
MGDALGHITTPVLAIQSTTIDQGKRVLLASETTSPWLTLLRRTIPRVQTAIINESGHFPMFDNPNAVNDEIAQFIAGVAANISSGRWP